MTLLRKLALMVIWLASFAIAGGLFTGAETDNGEIGQPGVGRVHGASGDAAWKAALVATAVAFVTVALYSLARRKLAIRRGEIEV